MEELHNLTSVKSNDVVPLVRPEGRYTILYGTHTTIQDPNALPSGLNGIFLETGRNDYVSDPIATLKNFKEGTLISPLSFKSINQYQAVFPKLESTRTPIYLADLFFSEFNIWDLSTNAIALTMLGEGIVGSVPLIDIYKNPKLSRRNFIKAAVGIWGVSPFASLVSLDPTLNNASDSVHPEIKALKRIAEEQSEFIVLTLREASIAHKLNYLVKDLGNNPHLGVFMGKGHRDAPTRRGLEWQIERPSEERMRYLSSAEPDIRWSIKPESFYQIVECRFSGQDWDVSRVLEVPELKRLVT